MWLSVRHPNLLLHRRVQKDSKEKALTWMKSCVGLVYKGSLNWGSWISGWFSWRSLFCIRASCSSSRHCYSASSERAVSLPCPYGGLNMHQHGGDISFNKKNGEEWRTQNILGSKKDRTFWHWCPLWRWKDPIHSCRGISTCLNVDSCLSALTLWAIRT